MALNAVVYSFLQQPEKVWD